MGVGFPTQEYLTVRPALHFFSQPVEHGVNDFVQQNQMRNSSPIKKIAETSQAERVFWKLYNWIFFSLTNDPAIAVERVAYLIPIILYL